MAEKTDEECDKKTCTGVPRSQVPGGSCTKKTCADLKKKKKPGDGETGGQPTPSQTEANRKGIAGTDANKRNADDGNRALARSVDFGDRMRQDDDDSKTMLGMLWALFGNKYARKLLKAFLFFLLGLKISRECYFMLIPMKYYSPWREPEFRFLC